MARLPSSLASGWTRSAKVLFDTKPHGPSSRYQSLPVRSDRWSGRQREEKWEEMEIAPRLARMRPFLRSREEWRGHPPMAAPSSRNKPPWPPGTRTPPVFRHQPRFPASPALRFHHAHMPAGCGHEKRQPTNPSPLTKLRCAFARLLQKIFAEGLFFFRVGKFPSVAWLFSARRAETRI